MILVTGAAGKTGTSVISALARRGEPVRAFVRRHEHASRTEAAGATETVSGDLLNGESLWEAAQGARALYHICPNMHPHEVEIGRLAIAAAQSVGIQHFVYHSVLHPQTREMPHHWHKLEVEDLLVAAGLPFTILQPAAYMQNLLGSWATIQSDGRLPLPYPVTTRISLVDLVDVGEAAARVLTEPGHAGATYELAGTPPLDQNEVAAILAQEMGRTVSAEEIPLDEWRRNARENGLNAYALDTLSSMFTYYANYGFTGNPNVLHWLLGRPPTSPAAFVRRMLDQGNPDCHF